jgi:NAD(P)-dependent dehydrogenase (short-subunit alcohol dehydrogenase family)
MAAPYFGLEGKRILVVGGGQGMGEATINIITDLGASVAIVDVELDRAERVAASVAAKGVKALPVKADVLVDDDVVAAIAKAERELGPLDGMATIVGMAGWSRIVETPMEVWDADHRRNLRYFFLAAREVAKNLMARGAPGSIVCVASIDGIRSAPYHASYGAAKAGLISLVKTMSMEWSEHGIRVNAVAPGSINTPRIPGDPATERESMAMVPMRRRGQVQDIGKAITFFLSDLSAYVTGQVLAVDGGYLAAGPIKYPEPAGPAGYTMGR